MLVAHVSDIHIGGSEQSVERALRVRDYLNALPSPVDAVVVTGDIADHGLVEEYEIAREAMRYDAPTLVCPGNHDSRPEFRKVLLDHGGRHETGPVNQTLRVDGLTVLLCDSSIPGRHDGWLDDETIGWLESELARAEGPVFVGMHHPPIALGLPSVDAIRLNHPERLEQVLRRHDQVKAVLVGHAHTAASAVFAGLPLAVAPGVVSTLMMPSELVLPDGWSEDDALDFERPPAFTLHVFDGERLVSHTRVVL
ncbi:metallophosphoesterase [Streptomyces stelliscabiei]|uniref:metallophosphoesterase n=1 Tax=Streptomyces stelliscabiei TaxID=146820 RepID=UPI0029A849CF|nr:metallophosphoesterase [Streptomyces stelliscabiei]MDX2661099.1 metallophosphoesterase [Streptomyces stelliscabiei]MDX2715966.1 metallophosphoesterase [Streptomyces stelliscabiei]MDX2790076.1 metallophosphoesterase [Streptomyces stelliscabiei]